MDGGGLLPPDGPMVMPIQSFRRWSRPSRRPRPLTRIGLHRGLVLGGALALSALAIYEMHRVVTFHGLTGLELVVLALYVLLVPWVALAFTNALAGAWVQLSRRRRGPERPPERLTTLTALLVPTHNESATAILANLEAIITSLATTGELSRFHVTILSDSNDANAVAAEMAAVRVLRAQVGRTTDVFYRHREENLDLKAGNIGDWVRRYGAPYHHFLVLDADSVMDGPTLVRLVATMEADPDVGVLQTAPTVVGGTTLFARMQQFGARVYGPVITSGLAWWAGTDGNYWGHNAMVRTGAFAEAAGLPHLGGRKPFGGQVMSHDFVEAALVRRAGWAVRLLPTTTGSYEESPPSLVDLATRDRRWCQGNLQHVALLRARGLRPISRLHLLIGIFGYLTSPLWLLFLLIGLLASLQARYLPLHHGTVGFDLFALPEQDADRARVLFVITMIVLLAPKGIALALLLARSTTRRACGGAAAVFASVGVETILSGLMAPISMLMQSRSVASALAGRDAGWKAQRRDGRISFGEIARRHAWHTVVGVVLGVAAGLASPWLLLWMSPIILGLVLSIPMSALTARTDIGQRARRLGLFRTPEEVAPPPVLAERDRQARSAA